MRCTRDVSAGKVRHLCVLECGANMSACDTQSQAPRHCPEHMFRPSLLAHACVYVALMCAAPTSTHGRSGRERRFGMREHTARACRAEGSFAQASSATARLT